MAKQLQAERRSEAITTKITPSERRELERVGRRDGLGLSDAVRRAILKDLGPGALGRSAP